MNRKPPASLSASPLIGGKKKIKVRLDHRTVILLSGMSVFKMWKQRYPDAHIIR